MPTHYALAVNKVYFVGHPVAVVVAEDRYLARDALDLIEVDYEELPPVTDPQKALQPDAPIIHEDLGTNLAFEWKIEGGDVDAAFAQAEVVVRQEFVNQRLIPVPMEPKVRPFRMGCGQSVADHLDFHPNPALSSFAGGGHA